MPTLMASRPSLATSRSRPIASRSRLTTSPLTTTTSRTTSSTSHVCRLAVPHPPRYYRAPLRTFPSQKTMRTTFVLSISTARWLLCATILSPIHLDAQTTVTVRSETGAPVPAAAVEWWSATSRIAVARTDSAGRASFNGSDASRARAILVRRIGFLPARQLTERVFDGSPSTEGTRGYTREGMIGARAQIASSGYVRRLRSGHSQELFGVWGYPPLHAELSGHFGDSLFGGAHTFRMVESISRLTTIRFCPRKGRRSGLEGTMRLDAFGALVDVRWTYWNPDRSGELAGGEVIFAPPSASASGPLLATSGLFWRRLPSGRFRQTWQRYSEWVLRP